MTNEPNSWSAYEKLVMNKLDTLEDRVDALDDKLTLVRIDVAGLKVRAGIWGAVAGLIPALVTSLAVLTGNL
jgi:hypothetical protein